MAGHYPRLPTRCGGRDRRNPFGEATPHVAAPLTVHRTVERELRRSTPEGGGKAPPWGGAVTAGD